MKKGFALLLAMALCMFACAALADDYGEGAVDASGGWTYLYEEPSSSSEVLGQYLTGTAVTLKSEETDGWIEVKIGRERGWMKTKHLKMGSAAERVQDEFWSGEVKATRYARMRKGPSTEYQFIRNVNDGETVTIMGKTEEDWYYVAYKGDEGFIAQNLIYTRARFSANDEEADEEEDEETYTPVPAQSWKTAYRAYILGNYHDLMTYELIYVDQDSIPELVIHTGAEAGGSMILTWHEGVMDVLQTRRLGFTYRQQENLLCNSDGHMGYYYDDVYEIRNGKWTLIAYGEYDNPEGWDEEQQRYICNHYVWCGNTVTEAEYMRRLSSVYNHVGARQANNLTDLPGIITLLRE